MLPRLYAVTDTLYARVERHTLMPRGAPRLRGTLMVYFFARAPQDMRRYR